MTAFSERVLKIIAEDKIRAAIEAGEFEHLPGFGKPLPLLEEPYDENWWLRRKLQAEQLGPCGSTGGHLNGQYFKETNVGRTGP